jgi:hypothetical protein
MYESDSDDEMESQPKVEPKVEPKARKPYTRRQPLSEEQKQAMKDRLAKAREARQTKKQAVQVTQPMPKLEKPKLEKSKPVTYSRAAETPQPTIVYNFYGQQPLMPEAPKPVTKTPTNPEPSPQPQRTRLSYATW